MISAATLGLCKMPSADHLFEAVLITVIAAVIIYWGQIVIRWAIFGQVPFGVERYKSTVPAVDDQPKKIDLWVLRRVLFVIYGNVRRYEPDDQDWKRWVFFGLTIRGHRPIIYRGRNHDGRGVAYLVGTKGRYLRWRRDGVVHDYEVVLSSVRKDRWRRMEMELSERIRRREILEARLQPATRARIDQLQFGSPAGNPTATPATKGWVLRKVG